MTRPFLASCLIISAFLVPLAHAADDTGATAAMASVDAQTSADTADVPRSTPEATPMGSNGYQQCLASLGRCPSDCSRCGMSIYPDCCKTGRGSWVPCGVPRPCSCPGACNK